MFHDLTTFQLIGIWFGFVIIVMLIFAWSLCRAASKPFPKKYITNIEIPTLPFFWDEGCGMTKEEHVKKLEKILRDFYDKQYESKAAGRLTPKPDDPKRVNWHATEEDA